MKFSPPAVKESTQFLSSNNHHSCFSPNFFAALIFQTSPSKPIFTTYIWEARKNLIECSDGDKKPRSFGKRHVACIRTAFNITVHTTASKNIMNTLCIFLALVVSTSAMPNNGDPDESHALACSPGTYEGEDGSCYRFTEKRPWVKPL